MKEQKEDFSVWPLMIDMLSSILIIFILFTFFDKLLNPQSIEQVLIDLKRRSFLVEFNSSFSKELNNRSIKTKQDFNYLQITFSNVLFDSGQPNLKKEGNAILSKFAKLVLQKSNENDLSKIQVEGHTDIDTYSPKNDNSLCYKCFPFPQDNWDLSAARALNVVKFLIKQNIPPEIFSANAFGEYVPVDATDKDKNRRIEIKVFFSAK